MEVAVHFLNELGECCVHTPNLKFIWRNARVGRQMVWRRPTSHGGNTCLVNGGHVNLLCIVITAGLDLPSFLATRNGVRRTNEMEQEGDRGQQNGDPDWCTHQGLLSSDR